MRITFKGNGVVWDAARGKNLCKFKSVGKVGQREGLRVRAISF